MKVAKPLALIFLTIALASCTKKQQTEITAQNNETQTAESAPPANEEQTKLPQSPAKNFIHNTAHAACESSVPRDALCA